MTTNARPVRRYGWLRLLLVIAAFACGAAGQYWLTIEPQPMQSAYAWGGALILFLGACFIGKEGNDLPAREASDLDTTTERILLGVVLAVGAFFSFYGLDRLPPGLNHDAAWEGLYGIRILNGEPYTPYAIEAWGRETLTFYLRAVSIWLMGPTATAVIAPGMVLGFLTLPLFYWWARNMFGPRFALVATLFLGVSGWHLVFSRTGWRSDFQPFFTVFTCCFFIRGMLTARPMDFLLAGVGLALTLNVYNAARVLPALFPLWLIAVRFQSWTGRGFRRRYFVPLLFMAAAFLIVIAPLAWFAATHWAAFQSRMDALRGQSTLTQAMRASVLLFNYFGNGDDFFVTEPALEYPTAVLFVFGLLWAIVRWKDERSQFLLLGFVIGLLPGLISRPNLNRDVGTMPFVYFFVAMGAMFLAQQLRVLVPRIGRHLAVIVLVGLCAAATAATFSQYLGPTRRTIWGFYPETTVVGQYLKPLVPNNAIWVGGDNYPRDSITYLTYQGTGNPQVRNYTWLDDLSVLRNARLSAPPGKGMVFLLANNFHGQAVFRYLEQRYPKHQVEELRYPPDDGAVFAKALLVPASEGGPVEAVVPVAEAAPALAPAGELREPRGVALAPDGTFYVSDFGHDRIQQFDAELKFVRQWGSTGSAPGEFKQPCGIAVSSDGVVLVADTWNHRAQAFSPTGTFLRQSQAQLYGPRGIAVGADGTVYMADSGNNRVVQLSKELVFQKAFGQRGSEPGQLLEPTGVAVDSKGFVYVADNGNGRMQRFSATGEHKSLFPVDGWKMEAFSEPQIAIDSSGRIWVSVPSAREVRAYSADGKVLETIAAVQSDKELFDRAIGVTLGGDKRSLVIADLANRLVRLPLK
jgi:sugar lactone lactonase YvrE